MTQHHHKVYHHDIYSIAEMLEYSVYHQLKIYLYYHSRQHHDSTSRYSIIIQGNIEEMFAMQKYENI